VPGDPDNAALIAVGFPSNCGRLDSTTFKIDKL
jgi:hypothetical protein